MRVSQPFTSLLSKLTIDEDLDISTFDLKMTDADKIYWESAMLKVASGEISARNIADSGYVSVYMAWVAFANGLAAKANNAIIQANDVNAHRLDMKARDTDSALATVAALVGAADPYLELTLPARMIPGSVPGAPLEGHFWYDATNDCLMYRDASGDIQVMTAGHLLGDNLWFSDDAEESSASASYVKVKEFTIGVGGTIRFKFSTKGSVGSSNTQAVVYRNGASVGVEKDNTTTSYIEHTDDVAGWSPMDLCQLYYKAYGGQDVYVKEFRGYVKHPLGYYLDGT